MSSYGDRVRFTFLFLSLALGLTAQADPDRAPNCAACHSTSRTTLAFPNFQSLTNLGSGARGLYKVSPGQTLAIDIVISNAYHELFGLSINNLDNNGLAHTANRLAYAPDAAWNNRTSYYTLGPTEAVRNYSFNLYINTNTPPDFYSIQAQIAGNTYSGLWSEVTNFYIQVLAPQPPQAFRPTLAYSHRAGTAFSSRVPTTNGFTYFLEYRTNLLRGAWSPATQAPGNGATQMLTDTNANSQERYYRVRVQ